MSYFSINEYIYIYKGYLVKVIHINVCSDISNITIYNKNLNLIITT